MQDIRKRLARAELENEPQPTELQRRMGARLREQPVLTALETNLQNLKEKNLGRAGRLRGRQTGTDQETESGRKDT